MWVDRITSVFLVKEYRPRNYCLVNDYTYHDEEATRIYGCQIYATYTVTRIGQIFGYLQKLQCPYMSLITTQRWTNYLS